MEINIFYVLQQNALLTKDSFMVQYADFNIIIVFT